MMGMIKEDGEKRVITHEIVQEIQEDTYKKLAAEEERKM